MEPWMSISLLAPPIQTTKLTDNIDVQGLRHICDNIIRVLTKQSPLHREGALLSRLVYKFDKKFKNDVGYRSIRKINATLHKYLQINLLKDVESFTAVLPNEDDDCIPTRQMLEYILSRIMTFSKVMVRIYVSCKQAAIFYLDRVKRGESHWMSLLPYSLLSRMWSMCAVLLQHATSWYACLHPYLSVLQPKGLQFLPEYYELPNNLDVWLDIKNLDTFGKLYWSQKTGLSLQGDEEIDSFDQILKYVSYINEENKLTDTENSFVTKVLKVDAAKDHLQVSNVSVTDHGQAISRDSFKVFPSMLEVETHKDKQQIVLQVDPVKTVSQVTSQMLKSFQKKIRNNNNGSHYFGKVTNARSLKDFLDEEELFRNDGNKQSLTKHLSFMQWLTLKKSLLKVCDSIINNRKIERKLQKVWKEKCLDYL